MIRIIELLTNKISRFWIYWNTPIDWEFFKIICNDVKEIMISFAIIGIICYSFLIAWWLFYPYEPLRVSSPLKIINTGKIVHTGGSLVYEVCYSKRMNLKGKLTRKLMNHYKIDLVDSDAVAPVGVDCDQIFVKIPHYVDPGEYTLLWSVTYPVNPIREVTVCTQTEQFKIINDEVNLSGKQGKKGDRGERGIQGVPGKNFWGK
jgi:hypothetical protein